MATPRYDEAVALVEQHREVTLAADLLTGADWARRYLNTTARLWHGTKAERRLAARGVRAMLQCISGEKPRIGRKKVGLTPDQVASGAVCVASWRVKVEAAWSKDPSTLHLSLERAADFKLTKGQRQTLRSMVLRHAKKAEVVLALASWETGVPVRALRHVTSVADMVYG